MNISEEALRLWLAVGCAVFIHATVKAAGTSSVPPTLPVQLWGVPSQTTGEKLDPKSASYAKEQQQGLKLQGRSSPFDPRSLTPLAALQRGDMVAIPLLGGERVTGKVNLVQQEDSGWIRVGGELTGSYAGSFSVSSGGKGVAGMILIPEERIAYVISEQPDGEVLMQEKPLSDVICFPYPRAGEEPVTAAGDSGPQGSPPILSSRPGATAVLYLDFDGETVTDPSWDNGNTIVAQPSPLTSAQITEVWNRVKEDYWPFNIDVTTDFSRYNIAPVGSRMRCIVTPTNWKLDGDGVAYVDSFDRAGPPPLPFSATIPCWVFVAGVKAIAEAASHELGHTLGLHHDGRSSPVEEYYEGHGGGDVGWAPIMGFGHSKQLVQWSKGEYAYANNQEDDLAIIANAANGFGNVADEAGNSIPSAATLNVFDGVVNQTGIISGNNDGDVYEFTTAAGNVSINATPASPSPNLDILFELRNSNGTVLASSNPDTLLYAAISQSVAAGTYYVRVQGTGRSNVLGLGYSSYGSIGHYSLSGTIPAVAPTITTQPVSQTVIAGETVSFSVAASGSVPLRYQWRRNGGNIAGATNASYMISNVQPNQAGNYTVVVSNKGGNPISTTAVLVVNVPPSITAQPQSRTVASGNNVTFSVTATGTTPLSYQWLKDGVSIPGATDASYTISSVQTTHGGNYTVVVSNPGGAVSSAVALLSVIVPPAISTEPRSRTIAIGGNVTFKVAASGSPPLSYQWRHDGLDISSANNTSHTIFNVQTNHAGNYTVVVTNAAGALTSAVAVLSVTTPLPGALYIANAGFEDPVVPDGQENDTSGYTVPGWMEFGEEAREEPPETHPWAWGVYNPDLTNIQAEAHGGENVLQSLAYLPSSQYVEQQLNDRLQSDKRYTLSAWIADPDDSPLSSVRLMLFAGSTLLGITDIQPTSEDTWTSGSLVIETGDNHPQVGQFLKIRIMWGNNASSRVFVDDVSLTASPVVPPGPAIPAPVVTSFSPASGPIDTPVTIIGKNFSATPSSNSVFIGGVRVPVGSASTNSLLITVPAGAVLGPISVTANRRIGTSTVLFNPTFDGTFDVSFAPPVSFSVGNNPRSVVVADFNRDGVSDLATANTFGDNLSVLIGTPTGGFGTPTNYPVGFQPLGVAVGDFNGDGFFDLVVASDHGTNSKVSLLLGGGNGGFWDASNYWVDDHPQGVAIGDFNGDGRTDLAVPAAAANRASVILGNGGGTLGIKTNFAVGQLPLGLTVADFNRDGIGDIATANAQNNSISVLLAAGDGSFGLRTDYMFSAGPQAVVAGDFNGDGEPDLATIFGPNRASLLIGMGDGSFLNTPDFTVGNSPIRLAVGDFNGDGKQDLVIGYYGSNIVSILLGSGNGTFSVKSDFSLGNITSTYGLAVGDFNRDGRPDIVAANNQENIVSVLLNTTPPSPLVFNSIKPQSNGTVLLNMSSPRGRNVTIFASPDLLNWFPVVTLTNAQETLQFIDTSAGSFERRFYRAVAE